MKPAQEVVQNRRSPYGDVVVGVEDSHEAQLLFHIHLHTESYGESLVRRLTV